MNQLNQVLTDRERRTAQLLSATIDSEVGDGTGDYYCIVTLTGHKVRASVMESGITYPLRFPVSLLQSDDGTVAKASRFTIIEDRARATQGSVYMLPQFAETVFDHEAVERISPESLTFNGAGTATVTIYGAGLDDAALDYESADLSDSSDPVQTSRRITLEIAYAGGGTLGQFDLTVGSIPFPNFFTIAA